MGTGHSVFPSVSYEARHADHHLVLFLVYWRERGFFVLPADHVIALDLQGRGWFTVVQAEGCEEGLDLLGSRKRDVLAVVVTSDGYSDTCVLADRVVDSNVPFVLMLAAELGDEGGGSSGEDVFIGRKRGAWGRHGLLDAETEPVKSNEPAVPVLLPAVSVIKRAFLRFAHFAVATGVGVCTVGTTGLPEVVGELRVGLGARISPWNIPFFDVKDIECGTGIKQLRAA